MDEEPECDEHGTEPADVERCIRLGARVAEELDVLAILIDGVACATEALENSEDALPMAMYYELSEIAERVRKCSANVQALTND